MRYALLSAAVLGGFVNILALSGPLFMLEIYDRVLPSGSVETLVALLALIIGLYAMSGLLDILRNRIMARVAGLIDQDITSKVIEVVAQAPLRTKAVDDILKPAREADQVRSFLAGPGPLALFDVPFVPLYLAVCFFLHPLIGWLASATLLLLIVLSVGAELMMRRDLAEVGHALSGRNRFGESVYRNAEAVAAMGILPDMTTRWQTLHLKAVAIQRRVGDIASLFSGLSKTLRQIVQSGTLALGAWLVLQGEMTAGAIIAASIIVARALQPVEQVLAHWRQLVTARAAWQRLQKIFKLFPEEAPRTQLPRPCRSLRLDAVYATVPGETQSMILSNISFEIETGTALGIIGPSASGKSSLTRVMTGVWPVLRGSLRLDGATLDQWAVRERGTIIGYMPQNSVLFSGTIAQNISRMSSTPCDESVIDAARAAGAHEMIVALPQGYETVVGETGFDLSAGQTQRLALARALFGNPFLVVLDEPNSNLDAEGELALSHAIARTKARGAIVVVVAHRNSILSQIDSLLVMESGSAKAFGPRDAILNSLKQQASQAARSQPAQRVPSLTVVESEGARHD